MILILFFYFISGFIFSQNIEVVLEKNISSIKKSFNYNEVENFKLDKDFKNRYRLKINVKNDAENSITAVVFRYSFSLVVKKDEKLFNTVSLFSSYFRISELKKSSIKKVYIYEINNLVDEIKKYIQAGYIPFLIKVDIMREPKKGYDFAFYSKEFQIFH